jgi:prepilin-type N-terminal cleavage/methylation domain-containing protein
MKILSLSGNPVKRRGFTLLEILLVLSITAASLLAVARGSTYVASLIKNYNDYTAAVFCLREAAFYVRINEGQAEEKKKDLEEKFVKRFNVDIKSGISENGLEAIDIEVSWSGRLRGRSITMPVITSEIYATQ